MLVLIQPSSAVLEDTEGAFVSRCPSISSSRIRLVDRCASSGTPSTNACESRGMRMAFEARRTAPAASAPVGLRRDDVINMKHVSTNEGAFAAGRSIKVASRRTLFKAKRSVS